MSFNNHNNHPQVLELKTIFQAIPLLLIVILVLSFMIYKGRQLNKSLTDVDIINYTSVHDKFHRTLILSGFCLLKIAKISL
ncbi:hypothetical protein ABTE85_15850, partial [Acinetobacter baumannii]